MVLVHINTQHCSMKVSLLILYVISIRNSEDEVCEGYALKSFNKKALLPEFQFTKLILMYNLHKEQKIIVMDVYDFFI